MKTFKTQVESSSITSFFKECENDLIHYSPKYLNFIESLGLGITTNYYCLSNDNNKILALMPVAKKSVKGKGAIINSLPFYGSHGGILFLKEVKNKAKIQKLILKELLNDVKKEKILSITLVENPFCAFDNNVMDSLNFKEIDYRLGQFKKIGEEMFSNIDDDLLMTFHSKTRNVVRKGLTFNPEFSEQMDDQTINWLQSVHQKSISSLNGKYKTKEVFSSLINFFPASNSSRLFICKVGGKKVAGILVLLYNKTVEYFTPVIEEEYKHTQLLSSLIYEAMKILSKEGYNLWNWGGTWESQKGVYRFKDRFGSFTLPYRYFTLVKDQSIRDFDKYTLASDFDFFYSYKFDS